MMLQSVKDLDIKLDILKAGSSIGGSRPGANANAEWHVITSWQKYISYAGGNGDKSGLVSCVAFNPDSSFS
jgi:hypothetical protein